MTKKNLNVQRRKTGQNVQEPYRVVEYEISTEAIQDRRYQRLPESVKERIEKLHFDAQNKPREAIPELLVLLEKYPELPLLYNYLSVAYSASGQTEKAEGVILENIKRNPDYLFARLNYAELCLRKHEYEKVNAIFDHKYDLKFLYPHRNRFHISEVTGFMSVMGLYFIGTGKPDIAEKYYEILKKIDPDSPLTQRLDRKLHPNFIYRLLQNILSH